MGPFIAFKTVKIHKKYGNNPGKFLILPYKALKKALIACLQLAQPNARYQSSEQRTRNEQGLAFTEDYLLQVIRKWTPFMFVLTSMLCGIYR